MVDAVLFSIAVGAGLLSISVGVVMGLFLACLLDKEDGTTTTNQRLPGGRQVNDEEGFMTDEEFSFAVSEHQDVLEKIRSLLTEHAMSLGSDDTGIFLVDDGRDIGYTGLYL